MAGKLVKVLELDQWSSTAKNIGTMGFADFDFGELQGGDSSAAKVIFGGHARVKEVPAHAYPPIGNVWFIEQNRKFVRWKTNYDSSD